MKQEIEMEANRRDARMMLLNVAGIALTVGMTWGAAVLGAWLVMP